MPNMKTTLLILISLSAVVTAASALAPAKREALHARFRNHSRRLLTKHGMTLVGFWVPNDADKGSGTTLVYLVAHKSREAATASWAAFRADPEWVRVKAESEKDGVLAEKVES